MIQAGVLAGAAGAAFVAGMLTTVTGVGGGVALIALLAFFFDPQTVVVLVAPVLMVGTTSRLILFRQHVDFKALRWFLAAALPAAALGGWLLFPYLPGDVLQLAIGLFMVLYVVYRLVWRGVATRRVIPAVSFLPIGLVTGVLSATVGASGPFLAPFLEARRLSRQSFVATMAGSTTGLNAAKMVGYVGAGVLSFSHLPELLAAMVGIGIGTLFGKRALERMSETAFRGLLLAVIGFSGIRLIFF